MKQVIIEETKTSINIHDVAEDTPIFAKLHGKLSGMIIKKRPSKDMWMLNLGGGTGACGWHPTRSGCIIRSMEFGYTFFIED